MILQPISSTSLMLFLFSFCMHTQLVIEGFPLLSIFTCFVKVHATRNKRSRDTAKQRPHINS